MNKKINKLVIPILMSSICFTLPSLSYAQQKDITTKGQNVVSQYKNFTFDVNPETSEIFVEKDGVRENASLPLPKKKIENLIKKVIVYHGVIQMNK